MIQKEKNNKNKKIFTKKRIILSLVFLVCGFFVFNLLGFNKAQAADCTEAQKSFCVSKCGAKADGGCYGSAPGGTACATNCTQGNGIIPFEPNRLCNIGGKETSWSQYKKSVGQDWICTEKLSKDGSPSVAKSTVETYSKNEAKRAENSSSKCSWYNLGACVLWALNAFLYAIFKLMGLLVGIAAILFDFSVNAGIFKTMMEMSAIKYGWGIVRDFLNIFFILVLLFSAFCTIFQVQKYHVKTILLHLVIMALLVNFSFPIARFIIDAGNIPMYYFLQAIGGGNGDSISKRLWNDSNGNVGLQEVLLPSIKGTSDVAGNFDQTFSIAAAIVFLFSFGITLLIMAMLLIIRILVLAILVIFSPVGFAATILPGSSLSKYADDWWEQLFKQSFFGTIMAFMLYMSLLIMKEAQTGVVATLQKMGEEANKNSVETFFSKAMISGITLAIPITLLWLGMIAAQQMGGKTSSIGMAGLKKAKGMGWKMTKGLAKATGIPGGIKQAADYYKKKGAPGFLGKVPGLRGSEKRENSESWVANKLTGGKAGLNAKGLERKRIAEKVSEYEKVDLSEKDAKAKLETGNKEEKKAAAQYLLKKEKLNTKEHYAMAMKAFEDPAEADPVTKLTEMQDKIKKQVKKDGRLDIIIDSEVGDNEASRSDVTYKNISDISPDKLSEHWKLLDDMDEESADPSRREALKKALNKIKDDDPSYITKASMKMNMKNRKRWKDAELTTKKTEKAASSNRNDQSQREGNEEQVARMFDDSK